MLQLMFIVMLFLYCGNTEKLDTFKCGIPKVTKASLILNGEDTVPGEWPWHVAIYIQTRRVSEYVCGGTLISDQFVLTAAHCVINQRNGYPFKANMFSTQMGRHNIKGINTDTIQQHDVNKVHMYAANFSQKSHKNDIALFELTTLVQFNEYVLPACVNQEPGLVGEIGTVVGWGLTEDDMLSEVLKKARLPAIDDIKCLASDRDLFGQTLDEGMFCAGYTNGTAVCNGDSGGGLVFQRNNVWYVGGIVSFSRHRSHVDSKCSGGGYAAFTKVQTYLPWILQITRLNLSEHRVNAVNDYRMSWLLRDW